MLHPEDQIIAGFLPFESSPDYLVFGLFDTYITWLINHLDDEDNELHIAILHELMHSVDLKELQKGNNLVNQIGNRISEYNRKPSNIFPQEYYALYATLKFVNHYRAEGFAVLCSSIL